MEAVRDKKDMVKYVMISNLRPDSASKGVSTLQLPQRLVKGYLEVKCT